MFCKTPIPQTQFCGKVGHDIEEVERWYLDCFDIPEVAKRWLLQFNYAISCCVDELRGILNRWTDLETLIRHPQNFEM